MREFDVMKLNINVKGKITYAKNKIDLMITVCSSVAKKLVVLRSGGAAGGGYVAMVQMQGEDAKRDFQMMQQSRV